MDARNIFNPNGLADQLDDVREQIRRVTLVTHGRGTYGRGERVPDIRSLRRQEKELILRIDALGSCGTARGTTLAKAG